MDFSQKFTFDATQAITTLRTLSDSLNNSAKALNNFSKAVSNVNNLTRGNTFGKYADNVSKTNQATSQVAASSSKAGSAMTTLKTRVDSAHASMGKAHISTAKFGGGLTKLGGIAKLAGGILVGQLAFRAIGALIQSFTEAFSSAVDLGNALAEVQTIGQGMVGSYSVLTEKVLALSSAFGQTAQTTAEGLYQTLSNQVVEAGNSFEFLSVAQGLATVTASSTEDAVNALSSVLNVYGQSAGSAYTISSKLAKTVELGRLRLGEMASSLGKVYPLAAALGISFEEVMAALATMTRQGTKANVSITQLRGVFLKLIKPSEALQEIFHKWGVEDGPQAIETFGGMGGVIKKLSQETGASSTEMARLFNRVRAMAGILALNTKEGELYADTLHEITNTSEFLNQALKRMSEAPARKLSLAFNEMKNEMIALTRLAIPLVTALVKGLTAVIKVAQDVSYEFIEAYDNVVKLTKEIGAFSADAMKSAIEGVSSVFERLGEVWDGFLTQVPLLDIALSKAADGASVTWDKVKDVVAGVYEKIESLSVYLMQNKAFNFFATTASNAIKILAEGVKSAASIIYEFLDILGPLLMIAPPIYAAVKAIQHFGGASKDASSSVNNFNAELQQFIRSQEELKKEQYWKEYWANFKRETEASLKIIAAWSRAWDAAPDHVGHAIDEIILEIEELSDTMGTEAKDMEDALTDAFEGPKEALETLNDVLNDTQDTAEKYKRSLEISKLAKDWQKAHKEAQYAIEDMRAALDTAMKSPVNTDAFKDAAKAIDKEFGNAMKAAEKLDREGKTSLANAIRKQADSFRQSLERTVKNDLIPAFDATQKTIDSAAGRMAKLNFKKMSAELERVKKEINEGVKNLEKLTAEQREESVEGMIRKLQQFRKGLKDISDKEWEIMASIDTKLIEKTIAGWDETLELEAMLKDGTLDRINDAIKKKSKDAFELLVEFEGAEAGQKFKNFIQKMQAEGVITSEVQLDKISLRKAFDEYNTFQKKIGENKQLSQTLSNEFGKVKADWAQTLQEMEYIGAFKLRVDYGAFDQIPEKGQEAVDQLFAMVNVAKERLDNALRTGEPIDVFDLQTLQTAIEMLIRTGELTNRESDQLRALNTQATLLTNSQSNYNSTLQSGVDLQEQQKQKVKGIVTATQQASTGTQQLKDGFAQVGTSVDGVSSKIGMLPTGVSQTRQSVDHVAAGVGNLGIIIGGIPGKALQIGASFKQIIGNVKNTGDKIGQLPGKVDKVGTSLQKVGTTNISAPIDNLSSKADNSAGSIQQVKTNLQTVNSTNISQPFTGFSQKATSSIQMVGTLVTQLMTKIQSLTTSVRQTSQAFAGIDSSQMVAIGTAVEVIRAGMAELTPQLASMADNLQATIEPVNTLQAFVPPDLTNFIEQLNQAAIKVGEIADAITDKLIPKIQSVPPEIGKITDAFEPVNTTIKNTADNLAKSFFAAIKSAIDNLAAMGKAVGGVNTAISYWPGTVRQIYPAIRHAIELMKQLKQAADIALQAVQNASSAGSSSARYGRYFASGGSNRGQDTIPAQLSKGEFVVNADATRKFYSELVAMNSGARSSYKNEGGSTTTVGDIHVHVNQQETERQTVRGIASELKREIRRGTIKL